MTGIVYIAAAYAAGVYISPKINVTIVLLFAAVYFAICLIRRIFRRGFGIVSALVITAFCLGAVLSYYYGIPSMSGVGRYENMYVTLTGRICEIPRTDYENNRYVVDVRYASVDGVTSEVRDHVLITSPVKFDYGDTVDFSGFVREIDGKMNENGFDLKRDYKSKGIFYRCFSASPVKSDTEIKSYSVYSYAQTLKNSISQILDKYVHGDKGLLLKAIIVGEPVKFSDEFGAVLTRTGTTRFFYPAFLHVMLIIGTVGLFSGITKRKYRDAALVVLLVLYAMAQSSHPVFVKCCLVAAFIVIFRRRLGYIWFPDVLGAVVLAVGISNPLMLYKAGFVMSIAASFLISLFYKPVSRRINVKNKYAKRMIVSASICSVGLLPLYALYFNGITTYHILYSFIFLAATLAIFALSPILIASLALFGRAPVIGEIITPMLWIYMKLPYLIDALPFSHIALPTVGALTIISFYAAVYGAYLICKEKRYNGFLAICAAVSMFSIVIAGEVPRLSQADFTFVNVGQGDGAILRLPYRGTVLIDGGGGNEFNEYDPGESVYLPYLNSLGLSDIDCAIVTHCHSDHAQGITAAIKNMRVHHLYLPETPVDNEIYRDLIIAARKYGTEIHTVTKPVSLKFKSGLKIAIYPPGENSLLGEDENDKSLLVRAAYNGVSCYYTGDMPKAEEYGLISSGFVGPADILKVAHHGSDTSTSEMFADAVRPEYSVISVGADNGYGLPSEAVLDRLSGSDILRTDKNGDITLTALKNGGLKVKTYK